MKNQIFISYSKKDSDFAHKLADDLETAGFIIWIDRSLVVGDEWEDTIENQIRAANEVIVILSPNAVSSKWVQHEGSIAYGLDKQMYPILMKVIDDEDHPIWAKKYQYHSFVEKEYSSALDALAAALTPPNPVQLMLNQMVDSYLTDNELVGQNILDKTRSNWGDLKVTDIGRDLLFNSALKTEHDLGYWLGQAGDKVKAIKKTVQHLLENRKHRVKVSTDIISSLDQSLREPFVSTLQEAFGNSNWRKKIDASSVLWTFRSWLPAKTKYEVLALLSIKWIFWSILGVSLIVLIAFGIRNITDLANKVPEISARWVTIPSGSFVMGFDQGEATYAEELCLEGTSIEFKHECYEAKKLLGGAGRLIGTTLPKYQIMDNEVTNIHYQHCVDDPDCQSKDGWTYDKDKLNHPATGLDWGSAMMFCKWLGGRLPTQGEWEKAARGPEGDGFPWGDVWKENHANIEKGEGGSALSIDKYDDDDNNDYGIKNMAGNVREWTATDCPNSNCNYDIGQSFSNDVLLEEYPEMRFVILRGGSWFNDRSYAMSAMRGTFKYDNESNKIGFRCVCPPGDICELP